MELWDLCVGVTSVSIGWLGPLSHLFVELSASVLSLYWLIASLYWFIRSGSFHEWMMNYWIHWLDKFLRSLNLLMDRFTDGLFIKSDLSINIYYLLSFLSWLSFHFLPTYFWSPSDHFRLLCPSRFILLTSILTARFIALVQNWSSRFSLNLRNNLIFSSNSCKYRNILQRLILELERTLSHQDYTNYFWNYFWKFEPHASW